MEQRYFYATQITKETILLDSEESRHCSIVLRHSIGDNISVLDGKGNCYLAEIVKLNKIVELKIIKTKFHERTNNLHLAVSPTKKADKMEWMVEKLTEIGVNTIYFINCDHSEKSRIKKERLQKKMVAAMKQSGQYWLPSLYLDFDFTNWLGMEGDNRWIAHCRTDVDKSSIVISNNSDIFICIGPEGDFSKKEIEMAISLGWKGLDLGSSRLRTETAAIVTCTIFNHLNVR